MRDSCTSLAPLPHAEEEQAFLLGNGFPDFVVSVQTFPNTTNAGHLQLKESSKRGKKGLRSRQVGNEGKGGFKESGLGREKINDSSEDPQSSSRTGHPHPFLSGTTELSGGDTGRKGATECEALQSQTKDRGIASSSQSPSNSPRVPEVIHWTETSFLTLHCFS